MSASLVRHWLHGLGAAFIGGGANAVTVMAIDPMKFNLQEGWKNLVTAFLVSGIVNAAFFLKQSPLPPEDETPQNMDHKKENP